MSIKKKLLIALLSVTVAVAGAASLAACTDNTTTPPGPGPSTENPTTVSVSNEAYEIAKANGVTGTKDEWLESLKSTYAIDGKEIKSVSANDEGNVVITYADDSTQTVTMAVKLYKVFCKDGISGNGVKGVWFEIYTVNANSVTVTPASAANRFAESDENGYATFLVTPEQDITYRVKLADIEALNSQLGSNLTSNLPDKYAAAFGRDNYGMNVTSFSFGSSREIEATFVNDENNFYTADKTNLTFVNGSAFANIVDLKANVYSYAYFNANSVSGTYKITVTSDSEVTMYKFSGSLNFVQVNENNIPAIVEYVTGGVKDAEYENGDNGAGYYTGTNSITLNITNDVASMDNLFGILSNTDCEVTVTVERTGNAVEEAPVQETKIPVPANILKYAEKPENTTLTLMPANGQIETVKGDDGYYHVGSKNGPVLLVQLNNAVSRVANEAISKLPEVILPGSTGADGKPVTQGDSALTFSIMENGKIIAKNNYADVIAAYAEKANSDGVYGVDETLYSFLHDYAAAGSMFEAKPGNQYNWLLPCQYYQPEGGLPVTGSGTSQNPYVIMNGNNGIEVNGTAYLSFTAADAGIYTFKSSAGEVVNNSAFTSDYNNSRVLYVCVSDASSEVKLTVSGNGTLTVTVASYDQANRNIAAEYDDDKQVTTGTENHPVNLMPGINNVIMSSVNDEGLWVNFNSAALAASTEFEFKIYDENLQIYYNGVYYDSNNVLKLTLENASTEYKLLITTKKNGDGKIYYGNYMLNIKAAQ